jgi:hypothetical protein
MSNLQVKSCTKKTTSPRAAMNSIKRMHQSRRAVRFLNINIFWPPLGYRWRSDFQCSIDYSRDNPSNRNRPARLLLTPKAFDNKAQGAPRTRRTLV